MEISNKLFILLLSENIAAVFGWFWFWVRMEKEFYDPERSQIAGR